MARINVEDKLYKDRRFTDLCIRLGSKWAALGALVEAWALAQGFVSPENPKAHVPIEKWREQRCCDEIIREGLGRVVTTDSGEVVELEGAEKQFAWLVAAQIKGRKGGLAKAGKLTDESSPANQNPSPATFLPSSGKPPYSLLSSHNSNSGVGDARARGAPPPPAEAAPPGKKFEPIPDLAGGPFLNTALEQIPEAVQRSWVERYDTVWLKQALTRAIEHYLARKQVRWPSEITIWPKLFDTWLGQERHPKLRANPVPHRPAAAPLIEIPVVPAEQVLSSASKLKLGPAAQAAISRLKPA